MWKDILKGTSILTAGVIFSRIFMFLFRYICMMSLSMENYGRLTLLITSFNALIIFAHFNFGNSVLKYWSDENESIKSKTQIYFNSIYLSFITSLIAFLFLLFIWAKIININFYLSISLLIGVFSFTFFTINWGFFIGNFKIKYSALINASLGLSRFLLIVLFLGIFNRINMNIVLYSFLIGALFPFILSILILKMKFNLVPNPFIKINFSKSKKIFSYSGFIMLSGIIFSLLEFYIRWILSKYSFESTALYDGAFLMYVAFQMIISSYIMNMIPHVSKKISKGESISIMSKMDIFFVLLIVIIISLIFNFTSLGINLLNIMHLGKYSYSLKIFSILIIAVPFSIYFGTYQAILQGVGKTRDLSLIVIIGSILYVIGSPVLIQYFGIFGAALMYILFYIALDIISLIFINRLNIPIKTIFVLKRVINKFSN